MAMFNKVLNIIVFVLAICAVVFGFLLFQKREELRKRGDSMARMINRVSTILDRNSGTEIKNQLIPKKLELDAEKDPNASKNEKISLYHDNYKNLQAVLRPFEQQADAVISQRDTLGTALNTVMVTLQVPQSESFAPSEFQNVATYEAKKNDLLAVVKKVSDRDNALVKQIVDSAEVIGFSIEADALQSLDEFSTPLEEFGTKVSVLKARSDTYESHIKSVCDILSISSPSLEGDDYADALATAKTAVQGVKDEFEQTKKDLKFTKEKLAETEDRLNQEIEKVAKLEKLNEKLKKEIVDLKGGDDAGDVEGGGDGRDFLVNKLEGKVLKVNKKWDFVVIDLGKEAAKNKMIIGKKNPKEINVALPEGKVMDITRNNKFLGQIKIIRVNDNCAIGDILAGNKQGSIEPGDKVFFARGAAKVDDAGDAAADDEDEDDDADADDEDDADEDDEDEADEDEADEE
jgi:hypothetical protein